VRYKMEGKGKKQQKSTRNATGYKRCAQLTILLRSCNYICRGAQVERFITFMHQL
jgi:hypothetical protein